MPEGQAFSLGPHNINLAQTSQRSGHSASLFQQRPQPGSWGWGGAVETCRKVSAQG